ncbi:macrophage mannose receptor 1 [Elysia marginata]|uniref:Macrophage mannose receptor 1 n=1 Tax=Elysia marginata TaxID=1093978 RepID=A0AAV4JMS1_9GAST|nr:macrophage mannose receptor 1 [Elysia marginata]
MDRVENKSPYGDCDMEYRKFLFRVWPFALTTNVLTARKICHAKCPDGWTVTPHADKCVKLFEEKKTWKEASEACGAGAQLVHIGNPRLKSFALNIIRNRYREVTNFWVGMTYGNGSDVFTSLHENEKTDKRPHADVCSMVTHDPEVLTGCQEKQGFICETQPTDCWNLDECVASVFRDKYHTNIDLILHFIGQAAYQLPRLCSALSECFGRHRRSDLCTSNKLTYEIQGFVNTFCTNYGQHLLNNAFKRCDLRQYRFLLGGLSEAMDRKAPIDDRAGNEELCHVLHSARLCFENYQHLCQSETFVDSFSTGLEVWDYVCSEGIELLGLEKKEAKNYQDLYKSMLHLQEDFITGFYEALSPSDRDFFQFHFADPFVSISEDLWRNLSDTEFTGMLEMVRWWKRSRSANHNVTKAWHSIWLKAMGEKGEYVSTMDHAWTSGFDLPHVIQTSKLYICPGSLQFQRWQPR